MYSSIFVLASTTIEKDHPGSEEQLSSSSQMMLMTMKKRMTLKRKMVVLASLWPMRLPVPLRVQN